MSDKSKMTYYFLSDIHLGENKSESHHKLTAFLETIKQPSEIFIVGDLFDFWFEYKSVIARAHFDILCLLKKIATKGINIHLITGNHDFWVDSFFSNELGINVHQKPLETNLDGKRIYIGHGDGLAKKDHGYRLLKRILQNKINIRMFKLFHPDFGYGLAHFFSNLSRNHTKLKDDSDYTFFAKQKFKEGFDFVVLAHTHQPLRLEEDNHVYINTGDWINHFTYGYLKDDQFELKYWRSL